MSEDKKGELAPIDDKPSLGEYIERWLPFKLPSIPFPQTRKNFDKAVSKLVLLAPEALTGWHRRRAKIMDAKADAQIEFINKGAEEAIARIEAGDKGLADRAVASAFGKQLQAQHNRERIAKFAAAEIEADPGSSEASAEIDDDWLNEFADRAARVSKEEMQVLWGRVLAGEIRRPGSFKLRTLQALSVLDADEAKLVHDHMDLVIDETALYAGENDEFANFEVMLNLAAIGVVQAAGGTINLNWAVANDFEVTVALAGNHGVRFQSNKRHKMELWNIYALTPFGKELYKLTTIEKPRDGLPEALARALRREAMKTELVILSPTLEPFKFKFKVVRDLVQVT